MWNANPQQILKPRIDRSALILKHDLQKLELLKQIEILERELRCPPSRLRPDPVIERTPMANRTAA